MCSLFCIVPDLPVCVDQRGGPQCCSAQFIMDQQMMAAQNFLEGLRLELTERFMSFDMLVERLRTCKFCIIIFLTVLKTMFA